MAPTKSNKVAKHEFKVPKRILKRNINKNCGYFKSTSYWVKYMFKMITPSILKLEYFNKTFLNKWNFLKHTFTKCDKQVFAKQIFSKAETVINRYHETAMIYNNLIQHCSSLNFDSIENTNYFIQRNEENPARRYAAYLWNWRQTDNAQSYDNHILHAERLILLTIRQMNQYDFEIVRELITYYYSEIFPDVNANISDTHLKENLVSKICTKEYEILLIFNEIIHTWFLIMPILVELSRYVGWRLLQQTNAFILGVDDLYSVLLSLVYKKYENEIVRSGCIFKMVEKLKK